MEVVEAPSALEGFWKKVFSEYWERKPFSWPNAPFDIAISEDALFQALLTVGPKKPDSDLPKMVFYLDGRPMIVDYEAFLPRRSDGDMAEYLRRVEAQVGDHDWTLTASGLHHVSNVVWDAAKEISDQVGSQDAGRPAGRVDVDAFIGRYASTGVGVHVDGASNFGFTLRGNKTLLTWPATMEGTVPQLTQAIEDAVPSAFPLDAQPGTVTYFPSEELHVGRSPDTATVSLNVAFFVDADPVADVMREMSSALRRRTFVSRPTSSQRSPVAVLPVDLSEVLEAAMSMVSHGEVVQRVLERSMRDTTSGGLKAGRPVVETSPFVAGGHVRLTPGARLLHAPAPTDGRTLVSTNGHLARIASHADVLQALSRLADGEGLVVPACDLARPDEAHTVLFATLYRLRTWGAVESLDAA